MLCCRGCVTKGVFQREGCRGLSFVTGLASYEAVFMNMRSVFVGGGAFSKRMLSQPPNT